ncbi:putative Pol polyprotein [Cricetulus griseus]|nr:putative Pol polyprotein [Cricetulus griseus]
MLIVKKPFSETRPVVLDNPARTRTIGFQGDVIVRSTYLFKEGPIYQESSTATSFGDTFSRQTFASAHSDEKAKDIKSHCLHASAYMRVPKQIMTDNGPTYVNRDFKHFCEDFEITPQNWMASSQFGFWSIVCAWFLLICLSHQKTHWAFVRNLPVLMLVGLQSKTESIYVAQGSFELTKVHLPLPPEWLGLKDSGYQGQISIPGPSQGILHYLRIWTSTPCSSSLSWSVTLGFSGSYEHQSLVSVFKEVTRIEIGASLYPVQEVILEEAVSDPMKDKISLSSSVLELIM